MVSSKKHKSKAWFINWYKYCQAYLELARIGLLELKDAHHLPKDSFREGAIYTDKILLIPVIWCLKHAIELLLKFLDIRISQEFSSVHDSTQLHDEIQNAFRTLGIKDSKSLSELLDLSDKYYKLKFWDSFLVSSGNINDDSNDILRYPESRTNFVLGIEELHRVTNENQLEIENDIERLNKLLLKLYGEITKAKIKKHK
jgi:hypothetical protein